MPAPDYGRLDYSVALRRLGAATTATGERTHMELSDYLRIARRHWLGIAIIVAAVVGLAGVYTVTQPKVYSADAAGFVVTGPADNPALDSVNDALAKSRAANYVKLATSRATAESAAADLGHGREPVFAG